MAESFERLDNILRDWAKDKVQKSLDEKQEEERKAVSLLENESEKILEQSQSVVKPDWTKHKICLGKPRTIVAYLEFNKPKKPNVYEINLFKKMNFSQSQNNCWHSDCLEWNIKTTS